MKVSMICMSVTRPAHGLPSDDEFIDVVMKNPAFDTRTTLSFRTSSKKAEKYVVGRSYDVELPE